LIVPTLNLTEVDKRCAMINHVLSIRECPVRIFAIQNFAFGGVNTSLFIKRGPDH
jgi:3-oxoacyl-[acyl-carrier-protein] synthase II